MPGNTPPPDMNENANFKRIEAFLKANNVIGGKIENIYNKDTNSCPMPIS